MEQDQFQIYGNGVQYQTVHQVDLIPAIDKEQARQRAGDQEFLAAVRENNRQRVENAKLAERDLQALSKFSGKLVDFLVDNQKKQNKRDHAAGIEIGLQRHREGTLNTTSFDEGLEVAKEQDAIASEVESDVLNNSGANYEASANIGKNTAWKQVGIREGFALGAVSGYSTFVDQRLGDKTFASSAEYAAALSKVRQEFYIEAGLAGKDSSLRPEFLVNNVYKQLTKDDAVLMRKWQKQFSIDDSFKRQAEASTTLLATKDVPSFLNSTRNTVDENGQPLGFSGAWGLFETELTDGIAAGKYSEGDLILMESQPIPGDPKGRTYGELYATRFGKIRRKAAAQRRKDWENEETDRRQEFEQAEQQLVDSFIDTADTDGFTDDQIDDAINTLRDEYGMESSELTALKTSTVDAKQREVQEDQIENLVANNLLTTDRLKRFDPKLQKKYLTVAQTTDKLLEANGGNLKVQLDAIEDMVEDKANVTRDSKKHHTVGLMVARQQQKFQKLVTDYAVGGSNDPVGDAFRQVEAEFESVKQSANGYAHEFAFDRGGVQLAQEEMDYRIRFIDTNLKSYGSNAIDMPNTFFSQDALKNMVKGFGSDNWTTDPQIDYIADKLGVDPLTVLNRQLKANGMDALPPSPAIEVVNKLTPTQQRLLNKYKTPDRSTRGLMGVSEFTPNIVPKGYGSLVESAAKKHNIDPAILSGLIETESGWNPNAISRSGAKGLTQFMDPTAAEFGVNVFDPASAIDGGARYLRYLIDYFNGDMRLAIFAYNGGMGNIQKFGGPIPGSRENQEYYGKVIRNAGKYGYGKQALRDPAILRPSIL